MHLEPATQAAIREHFCSQYPLEGCGLVLKDGSYVPSLNVSAAPYQQFAIPDEFYDEHKANVAAVVHSHCTAGMYRNYKLDTRTPSGSDIRGFMACQEGDELIPWGITHCDGENIEHFIWLGETHTIPLLEREFIHGYLDCYAACRDWYRVERDLIIPEFPRDVNWWNDEKQNLYMEGFEKAGFYPINEDEVKVGDAVLMRVASRQVNHAAVIVGDGQMFHHLFGQLSCIENYHRFQHPKNSIVMFLRHKTLNQEASQ